MTITERIQQTHLAVIIGTVAAAVVLALALATPATAHELEPVWRVSDFLGRVFAQDIGKRVYLRADILQAESNEQRDRRTQPAPMTVAEAITNERSPSR